jgi:hypothetical protein
MALTQLGQVQLPSAGLDRLLLTAEMMFVGIAVFSCWQFTEIANVFREWETIYPSKAKTHLTPQTTGTCMAETAGE